MKNWWNKLLSFLIKNKEEKIDSDDSICPLPSELDLKKVKRVLVIVPHPDDEVLGCGGTLALLAKSSHIKVILVTDGSGAGELPLGTDKIRQQEMKNSLSMLGINDLICLNEPDGFFRESTQFINQIKTCINQFKPEWIFIPSINDFHRDHSRIGISILKIIPSIHCPIRVFQFEVWNPVSATHVVNISSVMSTKLKALQCHKSVLSYAPYERAITGLAEYRSLYLPNNHSNQLFAECYQEYMIK